MDDYVIGNAAVAFLGVLVTVFVLCILKDESNFLLRSIIIIITTSLLGFAVGRFQKSNRKPAEISKFKIDLKTFLLGKNYSGKLIALLVSYFPQFLNATLFSLLYAISIFVLGEFRCWLGIGSCEAFYTTLLLSASLSSLCWIVVWPFFCCIFKSKLKNMVKDIYEDFSSFQADKNYKYKIKDKDRNLRTIIYIFLSILFLSWLGAILFPNLSENLSESLNLDKQFVSHFSILFIILNGFIIPVSLTWCMCCLTNISFFFRKKKWKQHLTLLTSLFRKKK